MELTVSNDVYTSPYLGPIRSNGDMMYAVFLLPRTMLMRRLKVRSNALLTSRPASSRIDTNHTAVIVTITGLGLGAVVTMYIGFASAAFDQSVPLRDC